MTSLCHIQKYGYKLLLFVIILMRTKADIELVKLADKSELPECGQVKEFFGSGQAICVVNIDGKIYAMDNICPHWGGPLGRGRIENGRLRCPWHGWEFDPTTGETLRSRDVKVPTFPVKIQGEDVFLELEVGRSTLQKE
jgi:nitrite reductase/ring-hydroxylating ferredoxin subunit